MERISMLTEDQILEFVKHTGPTLPTKVAKSINQQILFASAHLSDLVSRGQMRISKLKVGGSPLYYLPGQEDQLYRFAAGNINPKDLEVLDRLKKEKLLREQDLELLPRVALRALKDFAFPIEVNYQGNKDLFWKWYLLSDEELNILLKDFFELQEQSQQMIAEQEKRSLDLSDEDAEEIDNSSIQETKEDNEDKENKEPKENRGDNEDKENRSHHFSPEHDRLKAVQSTKVIQTTILETTLSKEKQKLGIKTKKEESEEFREVKENTKYKELRGEIKEQAREQVKEQVKEQARELGTIKKEQEGITTEKQRLESPLHHLEINGRHSDLKKELKKKATDDPFLPHLHDFFSRKEIKVENHEIIRKNAEIELLLKVPSAVGMMTYYCKAKNKKKCDEKDLSAAYMEAQIKKLPLLFLYSQELSKKAEEMLETGAFENVIVKKVE